MTSDTRNIAKLLAFAAFTAGAVAAFNFFVDPLQLFRPATFYRPFYSANSRVQNAGLVRSQIFDTVFLGSSLGMRYRKSDIDRIFGVSSVKLAMSGPSLDELNLVINAALAKSPKQIIWQMDDWMFRDGPDIEQSPYFPADLYRMNLRGVSTYLLNLKTASESLAVLLRQKRVTGNLARAFSNSDIEDVDEISTIARDFDYSNIFNSKKAIEAYRGYRDPRNLRELAGGYNYDAMVKNLERNAISIIKKNPNIKFTVYFPPYSVLQFAALRNFAPNVLDIIYRFNTYALNRLSEMQNVSLFDFRDDDTISHNLENYMDTVHHSPAIDIRVMEEIGEGRHLVDKGNPTASIERLKRQVQRYAIE